MKGRVHAYGRSPAVGAQDPFPEPWGMLGGEAQSLHVCLRIHSGGVVDVDVQPRQIEGGGLAGSSPEGVSRVALGLVE